MAARSIYKELTGRCTSRRSTTIRPNSAAPMNSASAPIPLVPPAAGCGNLLPHKHGWASREVRNQRPACAARTWLWPVIAIASRAGWRDSSTVSHGAPSPQALSFQPSAFSPETSVLSALIGVHRRPKWFFANERTPSSRSPMPTPAAGCPRCARQRADGRVLECAMLELLCETRRSSKPS